MTEDDDITNKLCEVINQNNLSIQQLVKILPRFLFSIGASLESCDLKTSEKVLQRYSENPTFGNALMAQALWMKETWVVVPKDEREEER